MSPDLGRPAEALGRHRASPQGLGRRDECEPRSPRSPDPSQEPSHGPVSSHGSGAGGLPPDRAVPHAGPARVRPPRSDRGVPPARRPPEDLGAAPLAGPPGPSRARPRCGDPARACGAGGSGAGGAVRVEPIWCGDHRCPYVAKACEAPTTDSPSTRFSLALGERVRFRAADRDRDWLQQGLVDLQHQENGADSFCLEQVDYDGAALRAIGSARSDARHDALEVITDPDGVPLHTPTAWLSSTRPQPGWERSSRTRSRFSPPPRRTASARSWPRESSEDCGGDASKASRRPPRPRSPASGRGRSALPPRPSATPQRTGRSFIGGSSPRRLRMRPGARARRR